MGSHVSPIAAIYSWRTLKNTASLKIWFRYVDDVLIIMTKDEVDGFTRHMNSNNKVIKCTTKMKSEDSISMLDTS